MILSVVSGSPADKAGLVQGDVIVDINGTAITSSDDLQKVIQNAKAGQSVSITYYVGDSKRTTTATLGSQAEAQQQQSTREHRCGRPTPSAGAGSPASGTPAVPEGRPSRQLTAPDGMSKFRSGWAGGTFIEPFGVHPLASMSSSTWAMLYVSSS